MDRLTKAFLATVDADLKAAEASSLEQSLSTAPLAERLRRAEELRDKQAEAKHARDAAGRLAYALSPSLASKLADMVAHARSRYAA